MSANSKTPGAIIEWEQLESGDLFNVRMNVMKTTYDAKPEWADDIEVKVEEPKKAVRLTGTAAGAIWVPGVYGVKVRFLGSLKHSYFSCYDAGLPTKELIGGAEVSQDW